MNLSVQHLSDEAVTAFADGMLGPAARNRASRHITACAECAGAIADQRVAITALRAAPSPSVPAALLERLRAVPVTTELTPSRLSVAPDGTEVFPAFGTAEYGAEASAVGHHLFGLPEFHFPVALPARVGRRAQHLALVTVAVAIISVGAVASAAAGTSAQGGPRTGPGTGPAEQVGNPGQSSRRDSGQVHLVGVVSKNQP